MHLISAALRRGTVLSIGMALVIGLAACSSSTESSAPAGSAGGGAGGGTATVENGEVTITAANLAFDASTIQATAGEDFTITLVNNDSAPHNIAIYTEEGGEKLASSDTVNAGETVTLDVTGLDAGTYYFQCDIHPEMNGSVEVTG